MAKNKYGGKQAAPQKTTATVVVPFEKKFTKKQKTIVVCLIVAIALILALLYLLFRPYKEATRLTEKVPVGA